MAVTRCKLTLCGSLVLLVLVLVAGTEFECQGEEDRCIYIQGFVPKKNPTFSTEAIIPAAELALEDINNSTEYLPNHELVLGFANTKVRLPLLMF